MAGWFNNVDLAPAIEVFQLTARYREDTDPHKVNLGVGAYRTDEGQPWVLPVVRNVEAMKAADQTLNHEYLPIVGKPDYRKAGVELLLGKASPAVTQNRVDAIQALGGTGALRIGFDFLKNRLGMDVIYISKPTWGNHRGIAKSLGYSKIVEYHYWNEEKMCLNFDGFKADLESAPPKSVIVLHACAHNPTGVDPTHEQWEQLAEIMKRKQLFPLFDCAYQGFATGDLDNDAWPVRRFVELGFEMFAAQSFSKNFGLYNERVGNLIFISSSSSSIPMIRSQMEIIVRTTWSNPPSHGCHIVATVLNNPSLRDEWETNLKTMANRILQMRQLLFDKLKVLGHRWQHVIDQKGMFSYTGLNKQQCDFLVNRKHIYLLGSGRVNMCGLTTKNMDYVAQAIHEALTTIKDDPKL
ncbi:hypothetical protein LSH36_788g03001 [Paralvinella palmiformis]|uniref:Aspartate aminotransferase n=1 Tax=Paralvinella palmiformis TaxID=53620 RepID=A0AAD9J1U0_9ANNE|nr:hypothetical protein LSH36_788g03001 [Paralvinella palmiformis]